MHEFVVIEVQENGHLNGLGGREFPVPPVAGDVLSWDDESGKAIFYEVVARFLPEGDVGTCGDLMVRIAGHGEPEGRLSIVKSRMED